MPEGIGKEFLNRRYMGRRNAAQLLVSFCAGQYGDLINTVYVLADATEENCVEVQALEW